MENLLWLLIIGGLFFFMHRRGMGCCGGGHHHGHGADPQAEDKSAVGPHPHEEDSAVERRDDERKPVEIS